MKKLCCITMLLCLPLMAHVQAAEVASSLHKLDAKIQNLQLNGVIDVKVRQGSSASIIVYGAEKDLPKVTATQSGENLRIDTARDMGNTNLRAEITLPQLSSVVAGGVGRSDFQGFSGDQLELDLKGARVMQFQGNYKNVAVQLRGVGAITLELGKNEVTDLKLSGAGGVVMRGQGKKLLADLSGLGGLDAEKFEADNVNLRVKGMGGASVYARQAAAISIAGMGSATIYGNPPTRSTAKSGLGSVNWK